MTRIFYALFFGFFRAFGRFVGSCVRLMAELLGSVKVSRRPPPPSAVRPLTPQPHPARGQGPGCFKVLAIAAGAVMVGITVLAVYLNVSGYEGESEGPASTQPSEVPPANAIPAAVLGGSEAAFDAALGPRAAPGSDGAFPMRTYLPCVGDESPQLSVGFDSGVATTVSYGPCAARILSGVAEAEAEAAAYFPPESIRLGEFTTQDGEPAVSYVSVALAAAIVTNTEFYFRDCDGNPVEPGVFSIVAMENEWFMAPGTCP